MMNLTRPTMPRLLQTILAIALIIMIVHTIIYFAFGIALIPFPYDYDQAEGFELNNAILLAQGGCPYCDNDVYPFFASGYAPFFHVLMVPFVWLFGAGYWYGRLIIFIATLITAAAITYAIQREQRQPLIAVILGLSYLASNYIYHIAPLLRQHLLMVMFETLAVITIATAFETDNHRHRKIAWAFFFLLLAGYTKQLAYSTCIAVALWLFIQRPRLSAIYSIILGIVAALIFAWAMLVTDGQWWINIISSNQNEYITQQFIGLMRQFWQLHWAILIPAFALLLIEIYLKRLSVYSIWFAVSFASTIGSGKWGAGDSYYATTLAATCIMTGRFLAMAVQHNWQLRKTYLQSLSDAIQRYSTPIAYITSLLLIAYGLTVVKFPTSGLLFEPISEAFNITPKFGHRYPLYDSAQWTVGYAVTGHFPSQEDYENGAYITQQARQTDGLVMSEDASFMIQADREVITNAVQLRNLWLNDLYDPTDLMQMLQNQEFGLIIRRGDFFPEPILVEIATYYQLDEVVPMNGFEYQLWRPIDEE